MQVSSGAQPDVLAIVGRMHESERLAQLGYRSIGAADRTVSLWARSVDSRIVEHSDDGSTTVMFGLTLGLGVDKLFRAAGRQGSRRLTPSVLDDPLGIVGHFAVLATDGEVLSVLTDQVGSVPVYVATHPADGWLVAGTNLGEVARLSDCTAIDQTSAFEFVQSGLITHPFTVFDGVSRVDPGSVANVAALDSGAPLEQETYWAPEGGRSIVDIDRLAATMREVLETNLRRLLEHHLTVTLLMSGGEDSRILAKYCRRLRPGTDDLRAVIFADAPNREWRLARAAARVIGIDFEARWREADHYTRGISQTVALVGGGIDLTHAHSTGLLLPTEADLFVDGWVADSYYKAHTVATITPKFFGIPIGLDRADLLSMKLGPDYWNDSETGRRVLARREQKLARLRKVRPWEEAIAWMSLWPISDHPHYGMFASNWRARPSASPYMFANMVALAAQLPLDRMVNRRVFHRAFSSSLGVVGLIPRTAGQVPRLSGRTNLVVTDLVKVAFRVSAAVQRWRGVTVAQGPWQSFTTRRDAVDMALAAAPQETLRAADSLARGCDERPFVGKWSTDQSHRLLQLAALLEPQ